MFRSLRARDERGITAVYVSVALIGLFAAAVLSVDAGTLWQTRRNMVTATDSAALTEAQLAAVNNPSAYTTDCAGSYQQVLTQNAGSTVFDTSCTMVSHGDGTGYVTVEARKPSSAKFGAVIGSGDTSAFSSSSAMWGYVTEGRGLRPMGVCMYNHHIQEWLSLQSGSMSQEEYDGLDDAASVLEHPIYPSATGVVHRVWYENLLGVDQQCGSFPGNWGWQNYNGGNAPTPERNDMIKYGYQGLVGIHDTSEGDCPADPGQGDADDSLIGCTPADSGSIAPSNNSALTAILGVPIWIPIFSDGECASTSGGGGLTCNFEVYAFLSVILRGFETAGSSDGRYLDFEFRVSPLMSGTCCSATPSNSILAPKGVRLCGADHDAMGPAGRCTTGS